MREGGFREDEQPERQRGGGPVDTVGRAEHQRRRGHRQREQPDPETGAYASHPLGVEVVLERREIGFVALEELPGDRLPVVVVAVAGARPNPRPGTEGGVDVDTDAPPHRGHERDDADRQRQHDPGRERPDRAGTGDADRRADEAQYDDGRSNRVLRPASDVPRRRPHPTVLPARRLDAEPRGVATVGRHPRLGPPGVVLSGGVGSVGHR